MAVTKFKERPEGFNEYINHLGQTVRIDPTLAHNFLCVVEAAKSTNGDCVVVIDGEEGSGKSTLGRQLAKLADTSFDETRIEFNPEDAVKAHFKGLPDKFDPVTYMKGGYPNKPWTAVILDESAKLDRKNTMSSSSKEFTGFCSQSRQLHKIFIIILPSVHMLEGYIAEHRAVFLLHCYKHERMSMGFYRWYTRKHIRKIFSPEMHRQKMYCREHAFQGRFSGKEAFDTTRYEQKKAAALEAYRKAESGVVLNEAELMTKWENYAIKRTIEKGLKHDKDIREALEIPRRTWEERKKNMRKTLGVSAPLRGSEKKLAAMAAEEEYKGLGPYEAEEE